MRVVRQDEVGALAEAVPAPEPGLDVAWLAGPTNGSELDVGLVRLAAGAATPLHLHVGGQVIIVISGRGFVETAAERVVVGPGDVVISPPGELHTHGAEGAGPMAHLTVTTGGYRFSE